MLTPAQYQALKTELNTDPRVYGYAALITAKDWNGLAAMLTLARDGTNGGPAIIIKRTDVTPVEILNAIDIRDFPSAPAGVNNIPLSQSWLESITQFATVRLFNDDDTATQTKNNIDRLINNVNGSQTRVNAVGKRNGSRVEELFGRNTGVTDGDVETALRS